MTTASSRDAHLRTRYEAAAATLKRAHDPQARTRAVLVLESAASAYATTPEGIQRIARDQEVCEQAADWDGAAMLAKAIQRGSDIRAARMQARTLLHGTAEPRAGGFSGGGPPEPIAWTPDSPVWPRRDAIDDALSGADIAPDRNSEAFAAYRALYQRAWVAIFPRDPDTGASLPMPSNQEGWTARAAATQRAARGLLGARLVKAKDIQEGWAIFNGYGIRLVRTVAQGPRVELATPEGRIRRTGTVSITYLDGRRDAQVPSDQEVVRLPALERDPRP